ncbi:MAG TPA: hypothetical protein VF147_01285, partial [Vicinamibacterales bacterium]
DADKFPRPEYTVRIEWTCDPARTDTLVKRVFDEIEFVKGTPFNSGQMGIIREALTRDFEKNSEENGYLLREISRRYEQGDTSDLAAVRSIADQVNALTGAAIQRAARTYLNTENYVKVIQTPERR